MKKGKNKDEYVYWLLQVILYTSFGHNWYDTCVFWLPHDEMVF